MEAVIISAGEELISGQCIDTNAAWLSAELGRFGLRVVQHITVGDVESALADAIHAALGHAQLVIITGGLGPTPDDITREAVASATGQRLVTSDEALAQITSMFDRMKRRITESDRRQAQIPEGGATVANPRGTAPGIYLKQGDSHLVALPGVPLEMKQMFATFVRPMVEGWMGPACARTERLLCFGTSEAAIGEKLADLMARDRNPLIGTTASEGVIAVRIMAGGVGPSEADALIAAEVAEVRRRLGSTVFGRGDETLAGVVAGLLLERELTLATAESCTGGLLAKQLTDIPGSSGYFLQGFVTYSNEAKTRLVGVSQSLIDKHGAVSEQVASAMVSGCLAAAGSDLAVSITGIAGPGGGCPPEKPVGLVYLGLADTTRTGTKRLNLGEQLSRSQIRDRSCKAALNWIRLWLLEL